MSTIARRGIHYMQKIQAEKVSPASLEQGQKGVIEASLALIRENAKLKVSHLWC